VTTTPVTQDRDRDTYNWQKRHEEILDRNRQIKPDVVVFGDSIIHYWGGEPKAPLVRGGEAWAECFAGISVLNLGFGWDRTENVLWRIGHGELDGIQPKVIIIKIGTNNIGLNSAEDIAAGVEAVCDAAHDKQPQAKILLLGILPRRDEEPGRSATEPVNQLLRAYGRGVDHVVFRDFGFAFRNAAGAPDAALFTDAVHINVAGYQILGARLRMELTCLLR
jgi:lysophospholipase L1-like esterase